MIETVDSFQGKQLDVIILSCVRASDRRSFPPSPSMLSCPCLVVARARQADSPRLLLSLCNIFAFHAVAWSLLDAGMQ